MKLAKCLLAAAAALSVTTACAEVLPAPQTTGGMPIMEAMQLRKSSREYNFDRPVTKQELSNLLWAAWGLTHDGKHTIGTAMNRQELIVYVITPTEASLYNPENNTLTTVVKGDLRNIAGSQDFAVQAPINIVLAVNTDLQKNPDYQGYTVGAASQNIYLYCAAAGLKTVVRGMFDHDKLPQAMKLPQNERIILVQTVGHWYAHNITA